MVRTICVLLLFPSLAFGQVKPSTPTVPTTWLPTKGVVREIPATDRSMIELTLREGFTTMVFLPAGEAILSVAGGGGRTKDGETMWPIDWAEGQNVLSVRRRLLGLRTNLHITSTSGSTYSFMVRESKVGQPDLKVYLAADETKPRPAKVAYVPAAEVEQIRVELQRTMASVDAAQQRAAEAVEAFKQAYPLRLKHYTIAPTAPFNVTGMWHDGEFTRITTTARELPIVLELKDGKEAEVNFQVQGSSGQTTYLIPKVLGSGYLKVGKLKLTFTAPVEAPSGN